MLSIRVSAAAWAAYAGERASEERSGNSLRIPLPPKVRQLLGRQRARRPLLCANRPAAGRADVVHYGRPAEPYDMVPAHPGDVRQGGVPAGLAAQGGHRVAVLRGQEASVRTGSSSGKHDAVRARTTTLVRSGCQVVHSCVPCTCWRCPARSALPSPPYPHVAYSLTAHTLPRTAPLHTHAAHMCVPFPLPLPSLASPAQNLTYALAPFPHLPPPEDGRPPAATALPLHRCPRNCANGRGVCLGAQGQPHGTCTW